MRILLVNDDGIAAPGIRALCEVLSADKEIEVVVAAPAHVLLCHVQVPYHTKLGWHHILRQKIRLWDWLYLQPCSF